MWYGSLSGSDLLDRLPWSVIPREATLVSVVDAATPGCEENQHPSGCSQSVPRTEAMLMSWALLPPRTMSGSKILLQPGSMLTSTVQAASNDFVWVCGPTAAEGHVHGLYSCQKS